MKKIIIFITLLIFIPFFIVTIYNKNYKEIELKYINPTYIRVKKLKENTIVKIPLEEYIVGVLAGEMPINFDLEALKAQAVASRSYALKRIEYNKDKEYDVVDSILNQVYLDEEYLKEAWGLNYVKNINKLRSAVNETIDEYLSYDDKVVDALFFSTSNGYTETSYKKMTTQIILLSYGYRFKNTVEWKNIPSTRSYDIIGIGIDTSVYISSDIVFQQNYCYSSGSCSSSNVSVLKNSTTGGAALFKLPTSSSITSMNSYIYFMVSKTSNDTLKSMYAYGDYAHAVKNTSSSNSSYYTINKTGLNLYSSIVDKYDEIPVAKATWTGTW